jgi:hypothetical protein
VPTAASVIRNFYRDSVTLMQLSSQLGQLPGIRHATAITGSEANRAYRRGVCRAVDIGRGICHRTANHE